MFDLTRRLRQWSRLTAIAVLCLIAHRAIAPANATAQSPAAGTAAASAQSQTGQITAAVTDFYRWYLGAFAKDQVPIKTDRARMEAHVTKELLQQIDKQMKSPDGLDADYFLKAQDYMDDWSSNIALSRIRVNGDAATATLTLGATKESKHLLAVRLVHENDTWKISRVSRVTQP
jgi:hypothetical protein